jgi:hypothetical protein
MKKKILHKRNRNKSRFPSYNNWKKWGLAEKAIKEMEELIEKYRNENIKRN